MKIQNFEYPKSSFLSVEKDLDIIMNSILRNERLKKLLYYTSRDCLKYPDITEEQTNELFKRNIKISPNVLVDEEVLNYLIISLDHYAITENPEFRQNIIEFDIVCHLDQWPLDGYALRPYKIAAELDSMFNKGKFSGIGELEFMGAMQVPIDDEFAGLCLTYKAYHGMDDKIKPVAPDDREIFENDKNNG